MPSGEEAPSFDEFTFVTADSHFSHVRIGGPGTTTVGVGGGDGRRLLARWNAIVRPDDVVLHLGDLALVGPVSGEL